MSNPYNCPDEVYAVMCDLSAPPLLCAVRQLGPKRVQYAGMTSVVNAHKDNGFANSYSVWLLDGVQAKFCDLLAAAGMSVIVARA